MAELDLSGAHAPGNVIFIVIDTLRADHVAWLGYDRETTPNLDAFAAGATVFTKAVSPSSWSLPSFASTLSGLYPFEHDFNMISQRTLSGSYAAAFEDAGYATASVQTNSLVDPLTGEFQTSYEYYLFPAADDRDVDSLAVDAAMFWVEGEKNAGDEPLFLFMGLFSPHRRYTPYAGAFEDYLADQRFDLSPLQSIDYTLFESVPGLDTVIRPEHLPDSMRALAQIAEPDPEFYFTDARLYTAAYDSEIARADAELGRFFTYLKTAGLYDDALIVVMADHGETMMEIPEYQFSHGNTVYNGEILVPLLIKFPGQEEQVTVDSWVSTMDVFPTIEDYYGLNLLDAEGESLLGAIADPSAATERPVISGLYTADGLRVSAILGDYKYIETLSPRTKETLATELYNLSADPYEMVNVAVANPGLVQGFTLILSQYGV